MVAQLQDQIDSLQREIKDLQKDIDDVEALLKKKRKSGDIKYLRQKVIQLREEKGRLQDKELILLRSAAAGEPLNPSD